MTDTSELERIYGEKVFTEEGFEDYHSPKDWVCPENDKFNNTVGIVKADMSDNSGAFKFGFVGKTPEWLFKNIIDNTDQKHKEVKVGTVQSNHVEDHIEWLDKKLDSAIWISMYQRGYSLFHFQFGMRFTLKQDITSNKFRIFFRNK